MIRPENVNDLSVMTGHLCYNYFKGAAGRLIQGWISNWQFIVWSGKKDGSRYFNNNLNCLTLSIKLAFVNLHLIHCVTVLNGTLISSYIQIDCTLLFFTLNLQHMWCFCTKLKIKEQQAPVAYYWCQNIYTHCFPCWLKHCWCFI